MKLIFANAAPLLLWVAMTMSFFSEVSGAKCFDGNPPFHPDNWMYCQEIVSEKLFMYYTPLEDTVMLGLYAAEGAKGWSSLALAGNGGMKGASQIVVRQDDATGDWIAEDRNSADYVTPSLDEQQDVQLLFAQQDEDSGETAWGVVIPQNSCDEEGFDYAIEDHNTFMLWALGSTHSFVYHGHDRGQFTANLMGPPPTIPDLEAYEHVDLMMPNVHVVRGEEDLDPTNPFICSYFDMEVFGQEKGFSVDDKIHMVGYEPALTEGNEEFVHHLVLFTCEGYATFEGQQGSGYTGLDDSHLSHGKVIQNCTSMPPGCTNMVAAWAVGAETPAYPKDVGVPIGEGQRWLVMQMHYYNPRLVKGVYDSSGIRAYLTKDLRPIDAGIMSFSSGTVEGQHPPLPGGMKDVQMSTLFVEPDCTSGWTEPLTVLDVSHHSHFMGLHQEITVERDGVNLGPMRKEFRFDYNHQSGTQPSDALRTLYPGDRLAVTCHFDTSSVSADSMVDIGEESNKEMCFPSLFYYPKQQLTAFMYYDMNVITPWYINDLSWCSLPPTNDTFDSLCAEKLFADVPTFFHNTFTQVFGYDGPSFTYPDMCNGGNETAELRAVLPICPNCTSPEGCGQEELVGWAQGVCEYNCGTLGVTVYPNLTRTEPFSTSTVGCPRTFFDAPTLSEAPACQIKGSLPQSIELLEVNGDSDESKATSEQVASESGGSTEESATGSGEEALAEIAKDISKSSAIGSAWNIKAGFWLFGIFFVYN